MKRYGVWIGVVAVLAISAAVRADIPFAVGESFGSIQTANDADGAVSIVILKASDGHSVTLQLDKIWLRPSSEEEEDLFTNIGGGGLPPESPVGVPAGPTRAILAFLPSIQDAGVEYFDIVLGDEKLSNQTTLVWTDFHIEFVAFGGGSIEVTGMPQPGTRLPEVQAVHGGGKYRFDFYGGMWANDGYLVSLFDNNLSQEKVVLRVYLGESPTIVQIKEWPTVPEPATMGILGIGSLGLTVLRRRRKA